MHEILLRNVSENDLEIFFEHQLDKDACQMVAFQSRDRNSFFAHWNKILNDEKTIIKTILFDGEVAGYVSSWMQSGNREIGYWIGKQYWGKGIGTRALSKFLIDVSERPLYAYVAKHNIGSIRVLEKCGFKIISEEKEDSKTGGPIIEGLIYSLESSPIEGVKI
jgi:RimJ/RimL family protein N-acetyltransferase